MRNIPINDRFPRVETVSWKDPGDKGVPFHKRDITDYPNCEWYGVPYYICEAKQFVWTAFCLFWISIGAAMLFGEDLWGPGRLSK